jgi:hypothetical protein
MEVLATLALILGASFCAGINLYATVFVLGAMSRWSSFNLPGDLMALESHWVLWPALAMYTVEFVADKVPAVDSAWDTIHTFIRVPAAVVIAAQALGDVPVEFQILAGMIGGSLAFASHTTKATVRLAGHATGSSPLLSPVASVAEDALVIGIVAFIAANPVMSLFLLALAMIACYYTLKTFWRLSRQAVRAMFGAAEEAIPPALPTA